ncbi:hypothetical protein F6X40_17540 [Paraburkholderia sp. UCT31]|uniref:hypothetical protein n=1 Tax=Paraburkholderia sp. UCT31 TaxID=2615209 RepID=UPI00165647C8|nr:hypothetical protein [Paraburkholderia sp. UCT31]MBC8738564.1 hypothetical protein [Paraburkholderia sp. UCT31]
MQMFVSRRRAVQELVTRRRLLTEELEQAKPPDCAALENGISDLERLILDVRAGRLNVFELVDKGGAVTRVFVS